MWSILLWNPEKGLVMNEAKGKTPLLFKSKQYSFLSKLSKEELVINMVVLKQLCVLFWKETKRKELFYGNSDNLGKSKYSVFFNRLSQNNCVNKHVLISNQIVSLMKEFILIFVKMTKIWLYYVKSNVADHDARRCHNKISKK